MDNPYRSPMTTEKPSGTAAKPGGKGGVFVSALLFGVAVQIFLFLLTSLVLDGGVLHRQYVVAMVGYWIAVAVIAVRRRAAPTRGDVAFLRYGNIGLLVAAPLIATLVYWFIGESHLSGLERWF